MVTIRVFADDSTDGNRQITLLAGYMATVDKWRVFDALWDEVLDKHDVFEFHARELFAPNGYGKYVSRLDKKEHRYGEWTEGKAAEFVRDLTNVLMDCKPRRLGASVDIPSFKALSYGERRHLTGGNWDPTKKTFKTHGSPNKPYFLAWQACLIQAHQQSIPNSQVLFVFSRDDASESRAVQHFEEIRRTQLQFSQRFSSVVYKSPSDSPGLQAADLYAYCLCNVTVKAAITPLKQLAIDGVFKYPGYWSVYDKAHMESTLKTLPAVQLSDIQAFPDPSRARKQPQ